MYVFLFAEVVTAATVTLDSIEIYNTHEFLGLQPTVFFRCNGENQTTLPDVKEKGVLYRFKGEESWQVPLYFTATLFLFF